MRNIFTPLLAILFCLLTSANIKAQSSDYDCLKAPLPTDKVIGTIKTECIENGGFVTYYKNGYVSKKTGRTKDVDKPEYKYILSYAAFAARSKMWTKYPDENYELRDLEWTEFEKLNQSTTNIDGYNIWLSITATVVKPGGASSSGSSSGKNSDPLSKALNKALQDIRDGSRIAIDQVRVTSDMDRNEYKDRVVELLLDKGFKVVAKDYLDKLYEEQKAQQSGKYNDKTVAQMGNFTGIGYYLNVRVTEETIRIQVINVSTGEYEGNVTVNL